MIGRVLLAALLAGIAAGLIMGAIQHLRLTPLILAAETYETPTHTHDAAAAGTMATMPAEHDHDAGWTPADGWQRTLFTTATAAMSGAAFSLLLAGVSLLIGLPINRRNGAIWGLCGFLAVSVAPSAGLPPELPGMPAADLLARQVWWVATAAATGFGLYLLATRRELWASALAVVAIGLPHLIGAPSPVTHESAVPPNLAAQFAANAIAAGAIFWALIGSFLGIAISHYVPDSQTA